MLWSYDEGLTMPDDGKPASLVTTARVAVGVVLGGLVLTAIGLVVFPLPDSVAEPRTHACFRFTLPMDGAVSYEEMTRCPAFAVGRRSY
jgi:hypothetical protein